MESNYIEVRLKNYSVAKGVIRTAGEKYRVSSVEEPYTGKYKYAIGFEFPDKATLIKTVDKLRTKFSDSIIVK